jgi:hypothetical protein
MSNLAKKHAVEYKGLKSSSFVGHFLSSRYIVVFLNRSLSQGLGDEGQELPRTDRHQGPRTIRCQDPP